MSELEKDIESLSFFLCDRDIETVIEVLNDNGVEYQINMQDALKYYNKYK